MAPDQNTNSLKLIWLPMTMAWIAPCVLVLNTPPTPQPFTELAALAVWGWLVTVLARSVLAFPGYTKRCWIGLVVLTVLLIHALRAGADGVEPIGMTSSAIFLLGAATLCLLSGARIANSNNSCEVLIAFYIGCSVLGAINISISFIQCFHPTWATDFPVAKALMPGRAIGNVRQPNHLATLLLWSAISLVPLMELKRLPRYPAVGIFIGLVTSVMLSASRTGAVELLILFGWGALDQRLSRSTRVLLLSTPLIYLASWGLTQWWATLTGAAFGLVERLTSPDASGAARLMNWRDAWTLIKMDPWSGVGFGNFNFAQTLTPAAERSGEIVGNAHNLLLHLAAELGVPSALAIVVLMLAGLLRAWRQTFGVGAEPTVVRRAAFVMLLPVAIHSQLEFPLWSAYFLLPTAFILGVCLALPSVARPGAASSPARSWSQVGCGTFVVAVSLLGTADYLKVVGMFDNGNGSAPMIERISYGQKSWFFGHHGDYAAATSASHPWLLENGFDRALHFALDGRLMVAWARTLHETGEEDKARYIAARLREMKRPESVAFFQACSEPAEPKPFQCLPPSQTLSWRSFEK